MLEQESTLFVLLLILAIGLIIPELFRKFKLPFISLIIILGAIFGPNGLGYIRISETIEFFGFLGMTFLMLMAGLETNFSIIKKSKNKVIVMSILNGLIPFFIGFFITRYFGYSQTTSLLIGVVFISSSVAIIVPSLKDSKLFEEKFGQMVLSSVLIADIASLIILGLILQNVNPITKLPITIYYILLAVSLILFFIYLPKISKYALKKEFSKDEGYERKIRFVIIIIIASLLYFSILGVHPILGSFLTGLMLSGVINKDKENLYSKLHTLGYGIFIPVFFFIIGMEMDLSLFKEFNISNILMISLILGLILSKFISGFIAGKLVKLKNKEASIFGTISTIQLTTTLAVTFTAALLGLFDNVLITSVILISIITTLAGPIVVSYIANKK